MEAEKTVHAEKAKGFRLKPVHILAIIVIVGIIIAVTYMATNKSSASSVVAVGDNISVYYTGTLTNGTVFDSNVGKQPLQFTVGAGELIKGFDQGVVGMKVNDTKTITLPPAEAYGEVNQSRIVDVPKSQFGNQTVTVGMVFSTGGGEQGTVKAINANSVTLDFNPPLAGQTLIFEIKIASINRR